MVVLPAPFSPTSAKRLAGVDGEVEIAHGPALGAGIAEADILEDDALPERHRERLRAWRLDDGRLDVEEGEQVVEIERLAGDLGEADQDLLEEAVELAERARRGTSDRRW